MVRCLSEKEVASLSYKANETASNKCSKYFIGGALGLYLFVYKPNKQGTSLKKYKLRKRVNNKDILSPLLDNNGKELWLLRLAFNRIGLIKTVVCFRIMQMSSLKWMKSHYLRLQ